MSDKNKEQKNVFAELEEEVQTFWEKSKTFEKSVETPAGEKPKGDYVFYDGPPFATGLPHYGHIVASIIKDVVPRFWAMNGYRVERKWGWDCHGLPIENIVEKELGSKTKAEIEKLGVEKFNNLCRSKVAGYVDDWKKVIGKLGRWADMENSYMTMDLDFMESVWWVFKEMHDKDLIYKGYRSMHVCPRCETTLSQSEVTEGYKDIKDLSAIAKFELVDEPGTYILAWTTTPWTLIGNVALAVGDNLEYVVLEVPDTYNSNDYDVKIELKPGSYIFSKEAAQTDKSKDSILHKLLWLTTFLKNKTIKGSDLVGKKYKPLFDYYSSKSNLENKENGWKVYSDKGNEFVTTEEGTGVVHIAPAFGEDDMNLGKEHNLPFVQHLTMDGNFKEEVKDFSDLNVKPKDNHMATDIEIIKHLAHAGTLFHKEKYEHSYPHCWRCDTPLLNYATSSWFVDVTKIKDELLENAKPINWSPGHIKDGRWGNWLEGARDWSISRQRFWASVMPIWECDKECGEQVVVGSVDELEKLSGTRVDDLHKHIVDKVTWKCSCGGTMTRIPDVLDTWFDSGSMPFAQMHYPHANKEKFENNFPAEFIAEGADQTRCWFYYMHVLATGTKKTNAFKNVIVNGIVLAEDGKKMSKKLQNYPDPMDVFNRFGADPLRYYLLTSPVMLADSLNFSEKGVSDALRRVNMTLWNVVKFYKLFETTPSPSLEQGGGLTRPDSDNILDQWILARLDQLITQVTKGMEDYNLPEASRPIADFIDDLSTWYIRSCRDRFKSGEEKDKKLGLETNRYVLTELSKILAPFTPFIAEQVWQTVTGNDFKDENKSVHLEAWPKESKKVDEIILADMKEIRTVVELSLAERDKEGIKVRQPLEKLDLVNSPIKEWDDQKKLLLLREVNIKNLGLLEDKSGKVSVKLDTNITPELEAEGNKRELVRFINALRKKAGLSIGDTVPVYFEAGEKIKNVINTYKNDIMKETLASEIVEGINDKAENINDVKVNGEEVKLAI